MKLRQVVIIAGATLVTFASISSKGQAATEVTAELDSYIPKTGDTVLGTCSQVGLCSPSQTLLLSTSMFPFLSINDSPFNVTTLKLTLDPTQDAIWSNGISNIYNNFQISPNGKTLTFSGGVIPVGEFLFADAPTIPLKTPVGISISFTGTPVPEPTSTLGTIFFGTIAAGSLLKRQLKF